jgi:hypothetical protein
VECDDESYDDFQEKQFHFVSRALPDEEKTNFLVTHYMQQIRVNKSE